MPAAAAAGLPLDRTRSRVRVLEAALLAAGVLVKAGRHRLVRSDRLDQFADAVTAPRKPR